MDNRYLEKIAGFGAIMSGIKSFGKGALRDAGAIGSDVRQAFNYGRQGSIGSAARILGTNKALQVGAGAAALGSASYALGREKKAALDELMAQGVDYDSAIIAIEHVSQKTLVG